MEIIELVPNNSRKSFYGKAYIEKDEDKEVLVSYSTKIMERTNGEYFRYGGHYSATTLRHIAAFSGRNKAAYYELPVKVK